MERELRVSGFRRRRERSSRRSPGGGGGGGDVATPLCWLLLLCGFFPAGRVFGQTETSDWLHRAAALQRYIGYDIPLSSKTLTATHNSFSHDRNISTHANFEVVTAQVYSMTDQLSCLGVRGLEIDLHYIDELAVEGDEESAIRMCHASEDVAEQMVDLCETFGWDVCEAADIFDYDEDTGCRPGAPTARAGFEEVASWLFLEENANEVLFLKLDSSLNDEDETVSTIVSDVFGEDVIFSPTDWEEFSGSDDWPSPAELVAMGTRVIIAGSESSTLVFSTDSDAVEVLISAEDFDTSECADVEGFPEPSWYRVQGDMVEYRLDRANSTIFELVPGSDEALTSSMTDNVMNCGFTPTFDRLDADLMESTIWSWDTDRPETGFDLPRAAVISSDGGRWTDVETDSDSGERHSFACRNSDLRYDWTVVAVDTGSSGSSGSSGSGSRRRRLTTTSTGDGDDDGSSASEIEFSDYSGEFSEADEACESVGYVFGAPRSAYENAILSFILSSAGLDSAWIDHTSEGESGGSGSSASGEPSLCWTHEGGSEYCVATSDGVCADVADPVTEVADGQLPDFLVREWEEDDYVRPDYTLSSTVEALHGWVRVSGDNEFDLSERDYVIGIILAAVPVFIFGFIVACCCLPVGHVAASSKQHHLDGGGFFGCFCPARCKRGDFMGSGTLGVVVFFTIVTIIGGAAAIYGVRSVDGQLVNLVSSLEDIGQAMGEAQTGVDSIYTLLTNVELSFEEVSSCSLVSSLEGVEAGIESAKLAVEELIEDDQLGSVSTNILELEEEFSNTQTTRRGVVYAAGALVLVMSVVYVSVGYYALGKDDGRGKAGGARMRGPVLIGCLILPLTLLVILLCWFLFGVSTSVALLTSDFCVDPSGHATEAFSKPADQELVAYYTSCEGANTFSDQLVTAYLQGSAAQGLLDALDDDEFATECPDEVESKETLDENIVLILAQIDSLGYLVQCGSVNPYFVEGVEEALCTDAPDAIWFVICGFAVVSVGLFVVAVSFRLLLQQKEEGLYKVIFEDEIEASETSSSYSGRSDDSWSRAHDLKKGSLAYDGGGRVQKGQEGSSSTPSTLPSSTPQGFGGGHHGVAAVAVSSSASKDLRQQQQQQQRQKQAVAGGRGRSTPVELATPLSRAAAAGGGGGRSGVPVEDFRQGGGYQEAAGARTGGGQRGAGSGAIARGRSRRSNGSSGNGRSGGGHIPMDNFASGRSSHSKLFRALAGLDDPEDEAPAVIVSRYADQRSTRNLGGPAGATTAGGGGGGGGAASRGELSGSGQLRYAFGRASSVAGGGGSRRRNNAPAFDEHDEDSDMDDDFSDSDGGFGGGAAGGKGRGQGSLGERSSNGGGGRKKSGRFSGGSGVSSAGVVAGPSAAATATAHGTWADFSRDCARRPDAPTLTSADNAEIFRSSRELRRSSHARSAAVGDAAAAAPGYEGRRGVPGGGGGAATTTRGDRAAQHAGESKHEDGGQVPRRRLGDGGGGGGGGAPGTAKVSPRSWNKAAAGGGGGKGTAATSTATRTTTTTTTTGMKGLSALSRPSPAETAAAESKQRRLGGPSSLGSSRWSGESSGGRASRDEAAAAATRRVAAVTGTAPTTSGRSGGGGGGGGVPAGGGGASARPGTRIRDAMKDRGGNGAGRG